MSRIAAGRRITWALLLCCLALTGVLLRELSQGTSGKPPAAAAEQGGAPEPSQLPSVAVFDPPARAAFDEILERPLFSQERRPPPEPEPERPAVQVIRPVTPLHVQLLGVATAGEVAVALIRDQNTLKLFRLSEGMEHQGWTVLSLEPGKVVFKRGEQTQELELELDKTRHPVQMTDRRMR